MGGDEIGGLGPDGQLARPPRRGRASSTPGRGARGTGSSRPAGACSRSPRSADTVEAARDARLRRRGDRNLRGDGDARRRRVGQGGDDPEVRAGRPRRALHRRARASTPCSRSSSWRSRRSRPPGRRARRRRRGAARAPAPVVDQGFVDAVDAREAVTRHDTAAFVDVVQERIGGPEAPWVHYGLTTSATWSTPRCARRWPRRWTLVGAEARRAARRPHEARGRVDRRGPSRAGPTASFAEPTTFGAKFALFALQADRDADRVRRARDGIAVGKLSGAVGTYSTIDPAVEAYVCAALGPGPDPGDPGGRARPARRGPLRLRRRRDHGRVLRHWRSASSRAATSARPTSPSPRARRARRRCPTSATRCAPSGSAAWHASCAATSSAGLEDVALWHERDISHSSVERVVLPDAIAADRLPAARGASLADGPRHRTPSAPWRTSTSAASGSVSQPVASCSRWSTRASPATTPTGSSSARASRGRRAAATCREVVEATPSVGLDAAELDGAFDPDRVLRPARPVPRRARRGAHDPRA